MPRIDENTFNAGKELEKLIADAIEGHVTPGALPQGCTWQCWVEVGPDGRPVVKCGIKCG
jgi:hypothetical protein